MSAFNDVLSAAQQHDRVKRYRGYYATCNPARDDDHPSLLFGESPSGKPWFKDLATDTDPPAILRAWGLNPDSLQTEINGHIKPPRRQPGPRRRRFLDFSRPDAIYNYTGESGAPVYQVRRVNFVNDKGEKDKSFRQYHWQDGRYLPGRGDTPELPYRLPEVAKAQLVIGGEGEKVVEALRSIGYVATTHAGGAKTVDKAMPAYKQWLRDKDFIYSPDNDQAGHDMAVTLERELLSTVRSGATLDPALFGGHKADIADLIDRRKKELWPNEDIRAEIDRILGQARPWQRQRGPKERERLAARDKYQAAAKSRAAELDARTRAHFDPDAIPFTIADDDEYRLKIARTRDTFSNAAAWKEYVEFHHPELDSAWEYQVKLQENREHKMSFCGRPFKRLTATGEHKPGRILCGLCESCKKLDRLNLRRALEAAVLADPEICLTMVTVADKVDRARITRRLREADISYKSFPVVSELHAGYDILAGSAAAALLAEYEPAELLLVNLNDAALDRWLETPEGERQSGDLIPSRRKLHEIGEPDRWECDPGPDTFSLELPGVVCEGELPEVYVEQTVHDVLSLQNALNEMADRQRSLMVRRGHVILGVISLKKYYPLNDEKAICEEFNRLNGERRGRIEARRGRQREKRQC